jgi:hypothetical protein
MVWAIRNKPQGGACFIYLIDLWGCIFFLTRCIFFGHMRRSLQITSDFPTACAHQSFDIYEICIRICDPKIQREHRHGVSNDCHYVTFSYLGRACSRLLYWNFVGEPTRSACAILISYQVGQYMARPREEISHATS